MAGLISTTILRTQTDERLVALARAGHERAFEAIVERYRAEIVRTLRRSMPAGAVDDVVQQTHLQAWKALTNGSEVLNLRAWLHRIARNAAIAASARGYDYDELEKALLVSPGPEEDLEHREVIRRALRGIARLPERQRSALLSVAVAGRPHADVAVELGISETAVRQLVRRARVTLRTAAAAFVPAPLVVWAAQFGSSSVAGEAAAGMGLAGVALKVGAVVVAVGGVATATPQVRDAIAQHTPSPIVSHVSRPKAAAHAAPVSLRSATAHHHTPAARKQIAIARRTAANVAAGAWRLPTWGTGTHKHKRAGSSGGQATTTTSVSASKPTTAAVGTSNRSSGSAMFAAFLAMMRAQRSTSSGTTYHSHTSHTYTGSSSATTSSGSTTSSATSTTATTPTAPTTTTTSPTTTTTTPPAQTTTTTAPSTTTTSSAATPQPAP